MFGKCTKSKVEWRHVMQGYCEVFRTMKHTNFPLSQLINTKMCLNGQLLNTKMCLNGLKSDKLLHGRPKFSRWKNKGSELKNWSFRFTVCWGRFKQKVMLRPKDHHSMKEYPIYRISANSFRTFMYCDQRSHYIRPNSKKYSRKYGISSLIHFGQIWYKKIKNKTGIFILSVNVKTFYSNIF